MRKQIYPTVQKVKEELAVLKLRQEKLKVEIQTGEARVTVGMEVSGRDVNKTVATDVDDSIAEGDLTQIKRDSGWPRHAWHQLKGGGSVDESFNNNAVGIVTKQNSVSKKQHLASTDLLKSPAKRRKLISDYKQITPRKSPLKTPTKRKVRRLRCSNVSCNVGFGSQQAKDLHERFYCSFTNTKSAELSTVSPSISLKDEKVCRVCGMKFSASRHRARHELNIHKIHAGAPSSVGSWASSPGFRAVSPVSTSGSSLNFT